MPTYASDKRRHTKFKEATVPVSFRLPITMAHKIKDNNWDLGQFVFNYMSTGEIPTLNNPIHGELLRKLIVLMIAEDVTVDSNYFTETEQQTITHIAVEEVE